MASRPPPPSEPEFTVEGAPTPEDLAAYRAEARRWLAERLPRRDDPLTRPWGQGPEAATSFRNLSHDGERDQIDALRDWVRQRQEAGYAAFDWEPEHGGAGLTPAHQAAYLTEEHDFETPAAHEAVAISTDLVGPTIRACGTDEQKRRYLRPLARCDELWCQLFSEPGAGSDVAAIETSARPDGEGWRVRGQKVWTSGAQFADFGYLLARTEPDAPKHAGLTAFLLDMRDPSVTVRPLRQMTGGTSFNEVFFDDTPVADDHRLGEPGGGWRVALTTLLFERAATGSESMDPTDDVLRLVRHLGTGDRALAQEAAALYIESRVARLLALRHQEAVRHTGTPGPESSMSKLHTARLNARAADLAGRVLGPSLVADTGAWGTFAWAEFVTGAPGYRIAGGTDEIQRTILGERVLGLPPEPRPPV